MIRIDCRQGSPEWHAARLGIPTASRFSDILTPKTRKLSASADKFAHELLAGHFLGEPIDSASSAYMSRGSEMEAEAVRWFEFDRDLVAERVGFVFRDDRRVGCSPDRLIGTDGGLEVKCPGARQHVSNLLNWSDGTEDHDMQAHEMQAQGCMWLCERSWWYILSYNPMLPMALVRVDRDDDLIADLASAVDAFLERMDEMRTRLVALGCVAPKLPLIVAA